MPADSGSDRGLTLLSDDEWQMSFGDRAALEGVLAAVQPQLAVEIGTAQGGSLRRIAARSAEVHSLDITFEFLTGERPQNAILHEGSSRDLLPGLLSEFAAGGRTVDFALVDGDHRPEGVAADVQALIESPATGPTVVLIHDSFHPWVRHGLGTVDWTQPKVRQFELDLVAGRVTLGSFDGELWGGFALLILDDQPRGSEPDIRIRHIDVDERLEVADAWESAVRAAPLITAIRTGEQAQPRSRLHRLAARIRGAGRRR